MWKRSLILTFALGVSGTVAVGRTPSFTGLGDLPGGTFESLGKGISADGTYVVGWGMSTPGYGAFLWSASGGMTDLGTLPGEAQSFGQGVSADGSVVVGTSMKGMGGTTRAVRWTRETGMVWLGEIYPGDPQGYCWCVSDDGSVAGGINEAWSTWEGFRWTAATGMVGIGDLPGGDYHSGVRACSSDGSVLAGHSVSSFGEEAIRWTQATGMAGLGCLPTYQRSQARGISSDGSVVVGYCSYLYSEGQEAFRWTASTGMVGLGDLPGDRVISQANDVSADGNVVVGYGNTEYGWPGQHAFIWDPAHGMRKLQDVLVNEYGLRLTGWTLREATAISDDGLVIAGWGHNPAGYKEAWIATIPEPATLGLLALGGAAMIRRQRRT